MSSYHDKNDVNSKEELIQAVLPQLERTAFRNELISAQVINRSISSDLRIRNCGRYFNSADAKQSFVVSNNKVVSSRFMTSSCERLSCPNCGRQRGEKAEREVAAIISAATEKGGKSQLIVATSRNAAHQDHEYLIATHHKAYAKFLRVMTPIERSKYGIAGVIAMPEISFTEAGINPHYNIVVVYEGQATDVTQKKVEDIFARIWIDVHMQEGMDRPTRKNGVVSQEIYDAKKVSSYLTKSYKHGAPRSLFNNGWEKPNGELDDAANGKVKNPHDILRLINNNPKIRKVFITLEKGESVTRLGKLDFGVANRATGEVRELKRLPKLIRIWLDYETVTKGMHIVSKTDPAKNPIRSNEIFWVEVLQGAAAKVIEAEQASFVDGRKVFELSLDIQEWLNTKSSMDEVKSALKIAALGVEADTDEEMASAIMEALKDIMEGNGFTKEASRISLAA